MAYKLLAGRAWHQLQFPTTTRAFLGDGVAQPGADFVGYPKPSEQACEVVPQAMERLHNPSRTATHAGVASRCARACTCMRSTRPVRGAPTATYLCAAPSFGKPEPLRINDVDWTDVGERSVSQPRDQVLPSEVARLLQACTREARHSIREEPWASS